MNQILALLSIRHVLLGGKKVLGENHHPNIQPEETSGSHIMWPLYFCLISTSEKSAHTYHNSDPHISHLRGSLRAGRGSLWSGRADGSKSQQKKNRTSEKLTRNSTQNKSPTTRIIVVISTNILGSFSSGAKTDPTNSFFIPGARKPLLVCTLDISRAVQRAI